MASRTEGDPCKFCSQNANYTCPRCNIRYCSIACYKNAEHGRCTEEFYKGCVIAEMKTLEADSEARNNMLKMLKRVAESDQKDNITDESGIPDEDENEGFDSDDDRELSGIRDRFADIDLGSDVDPEVMWSRLTEEEKREFEKLVAEPEAILPVWEPWWHEKTEPKLVEEISSRSFDFKLPSVQAITPLKNIMPNGKPSDLMRYNVVNVLYSYAVVARLHNGDHLELCEEAAETAWSISKTLSENHRFPDVTTSIYSALQCTRELKAFKIDNDFLASAILDVALIIEGPNWTNPCRYVWVALSDFIQLLKLASKKSKEVGHKRSLKRAAKKLDCMISWSNDFYSTLQQLITEIRDLHVKHVSEQFAHELQEQQTAKLPPQAPKLLIEDITRTH